VKPYQGMVGIYQKEITYQWYYCVNAYVNHYIYDFFSKLEFDGHYVKMKPLNIDTKILIAGYSKKYGSHVHI